MIPQRVKMKYNLSCLAIQSTFKVQYQPCSFIVLLKVFSSRETLTPKKLKKVQVCEKKEKNSLDRLDLSNFYTHRF